MASTAPNTSAKPTQSIVGRNDGKVLTTTLWNQVGNIYVTINGKQQKIDGQYNQYCPYYNDTNERAVTGCTNTADASVIYYWIEQGFDFDFSITNTSDITISNMYTDENPDDDIKKVTSTFIISDKGAEHGMLSVDATNEILASENRIANGDFIAAMTLWCGIINNSTYADATSSAAGARKVYQTLGFDSGQTIYNTNTTFYDRAANSLTDVGFSVLREVMDYGEIIRVGIPGHSIYMDGYRSDGKGGYEYHLNFGWGFAVDTRWYTVEELTTVKAEQGEGIRNIIIDLSPDVYVVVSSTRSDYYGGSIIRGLERINNIVNDKTTSFTFDSSIAGEKIDLDQAIAITGKAAVNVDFEDIALSISTTADKLFTSAYGMTFEMNGGSLIVSNEEAYAVIYGSGDACISIDMLDSFIYSGYSADGVDAVRKALDIDKEYSVKELSEDLLKDVNGYAVKAGAGDDVVSLDKASAMFGKVDLGEGKNVLNITDGSLLYGEFDGVKDTLDVNLTVGGDGCDAMIVWTTEESDKNFYEATGGVLDVTVNSWASTSQIYELYCGVSADYVAMYSVRLELNGEVYELNSSNQTIGDFTIGYNDNSLVLIYQAVAPEIIDFAASTGDWTNEDVILTADFSFGAIGKYSFDGKNWFNFDKSLAVDGNKVVYLKAVGLSGMESEVFEYEVACVDKDAPELTVSGNELIDWQVGSVTLSAVAGDQLSGLEGIYVSLDGKDWLRQSEITVNTSGAVYFKAVDNAGNETIVVENIAYLDNKAPEFILDYSSDWTNSVVTIEVTVNEDLSGIKYAEYSYDGENWYDVDTLYVRQNGMIYFRGEDNLGNYGEAEVEITNIDRTAPTMEISGNVEDWTVENVFLSVVANDDASGIKSVEYSFDNKTFFSGSEVEISGNCKVYFKVTDNAGNVTTDSVVVSKIDQDAPELTISGTPANWTNGDVVLNAAAKDALSGVAEIFVSKDGSVWTAQSSATLSENGKVYFKAVDAVGNEVISSANVNWIDKAAAELEVVGNAEAWTNGDVVLEAVASDDASGIKSVEYSFDNKTFFSGSKVSVSENTTVYFKVTDNAGNVTAGSEEVTFIDKAAAKLEVSGNAEDWTSGSVFLTASATDAASGVKSLEYSLDNKTFTAYNGAVEIKENTSVYFKATDNVGNVTVEEVVVDKIDKLAPVVNVSGNAVDWTNKDVVLKIDIADLSGAESVLYSFDNVNFAETFDNTVTVSENTMVYIKVTDKVGLSTTVSVDVNKIDKIAPEAPVVTVECPERMDNVSAQVSAEFGADSVRKQYSFDQVIWHDYTGLITLNASGDVYFRGIDRAGNTSVVAGSVNNVDSVADLKGSKYIFINSSFNVLNTAGKKQNNIDLVFNENAFASLEDAAAALESLDDFTVVMLDKNSEPGMALNGAAANVVLPTVKDTDCAYSYKSTANATGALIIADISNADSTFDRFATVNVMLDSTIGSINGGKSSQSQDIKNSVSKSGDMVDTLTQKYSEAVAGKITVHQSTVDYIGNYATVELGKNANVGTIENCVVNESVTGKATLGDTAVAATKASSASINSTGKLTVNDSSVDLVRGFAAVTANNAVLGNVERIGADGSAYGSYKDSFKVTTAKDGSVKAVMDEKFNAVRGGSFAAVDSLIGDVVNFDKVVLNGSSSGDLSNSLDVSASYKYEAIFSDVEEYLANGFETENAELVAMNVKKASNGSATVIDSTVGNIEGFKSVILSDAEVNGNVDQGENVVYKQTVKNGVQSVSATYSKNGSFKAVDSVVNGDIVNYANVQLDHTAAGDIIQSMVTKSVGRDWDDLSDTLKLSGSVALSRGSSVGTIANYSNIKLSGSSVEEVINASKITVDKGTSSLNSFVGTDGNDTLTIARGAALHVDSLDFGGGSDKLSIAGTLVLNSYDIKNLESLTGNGEIAATSDVISALDIDFKNIVDLGATAENFSGSANEIADNDIQKAFKWDGEDALGGWLGLDVDCVDSVDYIVFTADKDGVLEISSDAWLSDTADYVSLGGVAGEIVDGKASFAVSAGDELALRVVRRDSGSMSYTVTLA